MNEKNLKYFFTIWKIMQDFPSLGFQIIFKTKLNLNHSKILVYFTVFITTLTLKFNVKKFFYPSNIIFCEIQIWNYHINSSEDI